MFDLSTNQIVLLFVTYVVPAFFLFITFEDITNKTRREAVVFPLLALMPIINILLAVYIFTMDILRGKENR